jgi:hypothetical protein
VGNSNNSVKGTLSGKKNKNCIFSFCGTGVPPVLEKIGFISQKTGFIPQETGGTSVPQVCIHHCFPRNKLYFPRNRGDACSTSVYSSLFFNKQALFRKKQGGRLFHKCVFIIGDSRLFF